MADDALVHQAAHIPNSELLPHESLNQSLGKTKEIVTAVQFIQKQQEEADRKVNKEVRSHEKTKEKIKLAEAEYAKVREYMESEAMNHSIATDQLSKAEREHMKSRESLQAQRHEVSSMLLQMEALKVEMEAQRKAFVVNVNWASRCTDLKVKYDTSQSDFDKLYDQHSQTRDALETANKAREEYKTKSVTTLETLEEARKELARKKEELEGAGTISEDVQKKLEEWQKYKDVITAEQIASGRGKSKAMGVLERQLAEGDAGLVMNFFFAWFAFVRDDIKLRKTKDAAMKRAMKTIANEGIGLLSAVFTPWRKMTDDEKRRMIEASNRKLEEANKRSGGNADAARQKALKQLEKQFMGQDKALLKETFQGWALDKVNRGKKEESMKRGARLIANGGKALVAEVFQDWNADTEKARIKKKQKAGAQAKAGRLIADSGKALQANVYQVWSRWVKGESDTRKKKAAGNEKAARMITNSAGMLVNLCFDSWGKLQVEKRKKDQGGKKAARMMAGSNEAIVTTAFKGWKDQHYSGKKKEGNTAKAVRMIAASGEALQASCFQGWISHIRKSRDKNKKLKAIEKTLGASAEGLKMIIVTAWHNSTSLDVRKKNGKSRSMKMCMKSITSNQDMLYTQIYMGWARVHAKANVDKWQEKVDAAQAALDNAMTAATAAVEEDVARCNKEVDGLNKELEQVLKEWNDKKAKAEALENQIEERYGLVAERESQLQALLAELEESRRKARDIGEELAKVGIFLQGATPRDRPRSGAKSDKKDRPRSGAKSGDNGNLPKIGSKERPQSGQRK